MKKLTVLLVLMSFILLLGACNKKTENTTTKQEATSTVVTTTKEVVTTEARENINLYLIESLEVSTYSMEQVNYTLTGTSKQITWESNDESIAKVVIEGGIVYVAGVNEGSTDITATVGEVSKTFTVRVVKNTSYPRLVLSTDSVMPRVDGKIEVSAYVRFNGQDVTNVEVTWTSLDESIAKIENNYIVGIKEGTTIVRARCTFNGVELQEEIEVTVVHNPE